MIKRDKGNLYRADEPIERKLEYELDNIVHGVNQSLKKKNEEIAKMVKQISDLTVKGVGTGSAALTNMVAYNEQIFYGGENNNIIKDINNVESLITGVVLTDLTDLFTKAGHGLVNGNIIAISSIVTTTGLNTAIGYYVINVSGDNFQVSLINGGSPVSLGGGDGSCSIRKATVITLTNLQISDIVESVTVLTKTVDAGIVDFKISDDIGNNLFILDDLDASIISAQSSPRGMWIEYTQNAVLTLILVGATTFVGKVIIKILRKPQVNQGFAL